MDLYNVKNRRVENIDDQDQLHQALVSGSHSYPAGGQVRVLSPDGTPGFVPSENITSAVQGGYRVETGRQRQIREYVESNDGISGALKVGLGQMADEALVGLPELIYDKTGDPLEVAKKEALKKEHELANSLGGIGGFAASLFVGGPLWKGASKAGEATTQAARNLGAKISVQAGEEVGKRQATQVAKEIAAEAAGGAVEGALVSMPHAITEAALGDPSAAAETMLAGTGIGGVFGGGIGLSKELFGLGKKVANESKKLVDEKELTINEIARRTAKVVTGVEADDIKYYMKNSDRVNQAPSMEAIKDKIDNFVAQKTDDVVVSKELLKEANLDLRDGYRNAVRDLAQTRAPQSMADDLVRALENEKAILGDMSAVADDVLLEADGAIDRRALVSFVTKVKNDAASIQVGEKAVATGAKLDAMRERIKSQLPPKVPLVDVRTVLKQVRDDINWNRLASDFNESSNLARKKFTSNVSNMLKKRVPEYARMMDEMAERAKSLGQMSKSFGSRELAEKTLTTMLKPGNQVKREALDKFSELTGGNFSEEFAGLVAQKDLLERAKRENIEELLVPDLFEQKKRIQEQLTASESALAPIKRLSPNRSQQAIRNMGFKTPNIETRRAFEALEGMSESPILQEIKDRNILDSFSKASTQGSRKVDLFQMLGLSSAGGLAGMGLGGPVGAAMGAMAGATMDVYGGKVLKHFIDKSPNVSGLLFVEKAMKRTADKIDSIPKAIEANKKKKPLSKKTISIEALNRLLDADAKPDFSSENAAKTIEEIDEKMIAYLTNDSHFEDLIGKMATPIAEGGAPNISLGVTINTRRALEYLYTKVPRPPAPSSPFAPKISWTPSDYEMNKFSMAVQVASEPLSVIDEYENGGLTNEHMDALRNMFPEVAQLIQNKIFDYAMSDEKEDLGYQERINLSLLAGAPLDSSLSPEFILQMQQTPIEDVEEQQEQQKQESQSFAPKSNLDLADSTKTNFQSAVGSY